MQKSSLKTGHAGEHFACYVSLIQGYNAFKVGGQNKFDIIIGHKGCLFRVQVKTSQYKDKGKDSLSFQIRRRAMDYKTKKNVDYKYRKTDVDMFAFVSPEYLKVAFVPVVDVVNKYKMNLGEKDFDRYTLKKALERLDALL